MHRKNLLDKLARHRPWDTSEAQSLRRIEAFVRAQPECFERSLAIGHITGSAWLIDPAGERVLLTHHRKLGKWLQLGGHVDGNPDVLAAALREAQEESGLTGLKPVSEAIFDVDVHRIPARGDEPAHDHHDVRFLIQAMSDDQFHVSDESLALKWVSPADLDHLDTDDSVRRMHRKWLSRRRSS